MTDEAPATAPSPSSSPCSLDRPARPRRAAPGNPEPAADRPVARVAVDVALAHLDRPFDYPVPADLADAARARGAGAGALRRPAGGRLPGRARRGVRARRASGVPAGEVVSAEPVLAPATLDWPAPSPTATPAPWPTCCASPCRPGTPGPRPRAGSDRPPDPPAAARAPGAWERYRHGPALLDAVHAGCRRRGRCGRRCPARAGRPRSPTWSAPRWPPAAAPSWWCPTTATSAGSTRR